MKENRFAFRETLTTSNKPFAYTLREKTENELSLLSGVLFDGNDSVVISHAKDDFYDYLQYVYPDDTLTFDRRDSYFLDRETFSYYLHAYSRNPYKKPDLSLFMISYECPAPPIVQST